MPPEYAVYMSRIKLGILSRLEFYWKIGLRVIAPIIKKKQEEIVDLCLLDFFCSWCSLNQTV